MPFTFKKLSIPDVILVEAKAFPDDRGYFMESFKESIFKENGITRSFVQDNFSHSKKGVIRGLHYQKDPTAQAKLVTALRGKIFDVAVDVRKDSPTYGQWISEVLSDQDHKLLYVPRGFAHGFQALSDEADVLYKVDNEYSPDDERGVIWNDPDLKINWPIDNPIIIDKDNQLPTLQNADNNFVF